MDQDETVVLSTQRIDPMTNEWRAFETIRLHFRFSTTEKFRREKNEKSFTSIGKRIRIFSAVARSVRNGAWIWTETDLSVVDF